jgi:tRNA(Arg) A34 adenosine deaminase TadA
MSEMISLKDLQFISVAAEEGMKSDVLMRHGCVAVMNGKIIGKGHNNYRNRTQDGFVNYSNQCTCHAEMAALRNVYHKCCDNTFGKWSDSLKVADQSETF